MNRRQKIIVSVTGIFLVLLILVGLTYAYFLTQIVGNTNPKSISVTTANLKLTYGDGTTQILTSDTKLVPSSTEIGTKDFTVTNNGDATSYVVLIENVVIKDATTGELTIFNSNDFVYTLECTSNKGTCNSVSTQTTMPLSDALLVTNDIEEDEVHTYTMTVWYLETNKDQSSDMNKTLEARINIEGESSINPYFNNPNSLAYNIINNALNVSNEEINNGYAAYRSKPLTKPAEEISGRFIGTDPTSYSTWTMSTTYQGYYYVVGDDYTGGTGGFKLVNPRVVKYSEGYEELKGKYITSYLGYSSESTANMNATEGKTFNSLYKVGVSTTLSTLYYGNVSKSIESVESSLSVASDDYTATTGYNSYYYRGGVENNYVEFNGMCWRIVRIEGDGSVKLTLAKQGSCSTITDSDTGSAFIGTGDYGYKTIFYADYENSENRDTSMKYKFNEWFNTNMSSVSDKLKTTQICIGDTTKYDESGNKLTDNEASELGGWDYNNYIRLSINKTAQLTCDANGLSVNSYQIYPLTADEVVFAGGNYGLSNFSYYLRDNASDGDYYDWLTLSLASYFVDGDRVFSVYIENANVSITSVPPYLANIASLRPAISLIPDIELASDSGDGTMMNPYKVK